MSTNAKPAAQGNCPKCGKRIDSSARAGSLTSYLFQNFSCQCGNASAQPTLRQTARDDSNDFCPKCGLRNAGEVRAGSITGFLFQDIRCKCTPDENFSQGTMSKRLWKLKQADQGSTFSKDGGEEADQRSVKSIGLAKGAIIGGAYRIIRIIGRGGMGEVYLAEHQVLNKRCALKVIPPEQVTEMNWLRFQAEAKAIAKLDHANLVRVSDLGIHDGCLPFYAMEYVDGRTMADLIQDQGPMPLKTAFSIFDQICNGLDYSHRNGIIHRDLKPANIMLSKGSDGSISVKVLDFGLAKLTQKDRAAQSLTTAGEVMGSPFYMSPEQCEGGRIDRRSDIYSLGCTLFECLVGTPPFDADNAAVIVNKHLTEDAPSLESVVGSGVFPEALEVVIAKLLRKNPVERYQSMSELRADLERVEKGESVLPFYMSRSSKSDRNGMPEPIALNKFQPETARAEPGEQKQNLPGNRKTMIGAIFIVLICAALFGTLFMYQRPPGQHQTDLHQTDLHRATPGVSSGVNEKEQSDKAKRGTD